MDSLILQLFNYAASILTMGAATLTSTQSLIQTIVSSLKAVQDLMVEKFDLKPEDLTPDATLEGLGLDSLSVIEFTFDLEDRLNIKMPEKRLELNTLQDVVNLLDELAADQKKHPETVNAHL